MIVFFIFYFVFNLFLNVYSSNFYSKFKCKNVKCNSQCLDQHIIHYEKLKIDLEKKISDEKKRTKDFLKGCYDVEKKVKELIEECETKTNIFKKNLYLFHDSGKKNKKLIFYKKIIEKIEDGYSQKIQNITTEDINIDNPEDIKERASIVLKRLEKELELVNQKLTEFKLKKLEFAKDRLKRAFDNEQNKKEQEINNNNNMQQQQVENNEQNKQEQQQEEKLEQTLQVFQNQFEKMSSLLGPFFNYPKRNPLYFKIKLKRKGKFPDIFNADFSRVNVFFDFFSYLEHLFPRQSLIGFNSCYFLGHYINKKKTMIDLLEQHFLNFYEEWLEKNKNKLLSNEGKEMKNKKYNKMVLRIKEENRVFINNIIKMLKRKYTYSFLAMYNLLELKIFSDYLKNLFFAEENQAKYIIYKFSQELPSVQRYFITQNLPLVSFMYPLFSYSGLDGSINKIATPVV